MCSWSSFLVCAASGSVYGIVLQRMRVSLSAYLRPLSTGKRKSEIKFVGKRIFFAFHSSYRVASGFSEESTHEKCAPGRKASLLYMSLLVIFCRLKNLVLPWARYTYLRYASSVIKRPPSNSNGKLESVGGLFNKWRPRRDSNSRPTA